MAKRYLAVIGVCLLSLFCLLSCGLEAFYYIDYIDDGDYFDTRAVIRLPSNSSDGYGANGNYFDNFIIFYRIYISGINTSTGPHLTADTSPERSAINSSLDTDYRNIYSLTDKTSTSVNTSNLKNTFLNRNYYPLSLEGADINSVLGSGSLGKRLEIVFDTRNGIRPTLTLDGGDTTYNLQRAGPPDYDWNPLPGDSADIYRSFLNHPDLYNKDNATKEINGDVATNSRDPDLHYTYVSMYIAAKGTSLEMPPKDIYSQPTFIGIFRLTDFS